MVSEALVRVEEIPSHVFRYVERELYDYPVHKAALSTVQAEREALRDKLRPWPPPEGRREEGPPSDLAETYLQIEALNLRELRAWKNVRRIETVFDTLSDEQKKLVELKYWSGKYTNDRMAKELNVGRTKFYEMRYEVVRLFALGYGLL